MMTIGSLFSGIGGLELGLEMAGLGPTLWQVERDDYRRAVLAKHWPHAKRFPDVQRFYGSSVARPGVLCGGFPCQDISSAGTREGLTGARSGLWHQFARIVGECRPDWVVVENVASNASAWVDAVVRDLEREGYEALPLPISAGACDAPHRRARVFIVARMVADVARIGRHARPERQPGARGGDSADESTPPDAHRESLRLDQQRHSARWPRGVRDEGDALARFPSWSGGSFAAPDMVRMVHGFPSRVDPIRAARIAALGDAVVPQCAEVVGWVIRELAGLTEAA